MKTNHKNFVIRLTFAGLCLALCWLLPFLTGQLQQIGKMLSPMHIPVLLCGFICGPWYGLAIGFIAPLTRSLMFNMPVMFPTAVAMAFELACYGLSTGILYRLLPKKNGYIYVTLLLSMILGRLVWGAVECILMLTGKIDFSFSLFISGVITGSIPGIVLQIILIPILVMALQKAGIIRHESLRKKK